MWKGFGPATFKPTVNPLTGMPYTFAKDGFEATAYTIATDQFGTQLDPPAHWAPEYPAIDELPATYAVRPLVVISIVKQLKTKADYHLQVADITKWEKQHGRIPEGSVVMVRSDWSKKWTTDAVKAKALAAETVFPGVSLKAIQFLHLKRHILFHGHEPLDTDTTPTLEGEAWLMHHGYTQAEGVDNLDAVPETGLPGEHRLPEVRRRPRRLRPLHRDLPARDQGHEDLPRGCADEEALQDPPLRRDPRDARPLTTERAGRSGIGRPASHCRATRW